MGGRLTTYANTAAAMPELKKLEQQHALEAQSALAHLLED